MFFFWCGLADWEIHGDYIPVNFGVYKKLYLCYGYKIFTCKIDVNFYVKTDSMVITIFYIYILLLLLKVIGIVYL